MTEPTDALISTKEAARLLGIAPITLRVLARSGKSPIPFVRYGAKGHYRWSRAAIQDLVSSHDQYHRLPSTRA